MHPRGPQSGVVWQHGRELASWGEPARADLTFSVAKTYLALLAGVAHGLGLLPDADEAVVRRLPGIGFGTGSLGGADAGGAAGARDGGHGSERNSAIRNSTIRNSTIRNSTIRNSAIRNKAMRNNSITWDHLLTQTSEWEGECFGLPDTVDRWRRVSQDSRPAGGPKGGARPLQAPGAYWEYNDVRINQLALALLHLFGRPLPEVFLEQVLRPLGGGEGFAWRGYDDAWVELPGVGRVQSVPGGSHWGAGVSISSHDQARIGQLLLARGAHAGRQLVPAPWIDRLFEPCPIAPFYGRLLWLNRDGKAFAGASKQAACMVGAGGHYTWVDPGLDAVVVLRWLDSQAAPATMRQIADALAAH